MMKEDAGVTASPSGHSAKPEPKVSALRASVLNALQRFIAWLGPFGVLIVGMGLMMAGVSIADANIAISVVGGLMILSSLELYADRTKAKETARWARHIADMVGGEGTTTFEVKHTFESIRPELDNLIACEVAIAMEAAKPSRRETGSTEGDSAGRRHRPPSVYQPKGEEG